MKLQYLKHMKAWIAVYQGRPLCAGINLSQVIADAITIIKR